MTVQEQEQKKKLRKSYAQLLDECESTQDKLAMVYVPQFCQALRDENPNMTNDEIRGKVFIDCRTRFGWGGKTGSTIYHNFPSWLIEDNPNHKRVVKNWETRHANMLKSSAVTAEKLAEKLNDIPLPPEPKIDEEFEQTMQEMHVIEYAETGKSLRELTGAISKSGYDLIEALSNNGRPPTSFSDFMNDYIKKSREFRRGVMMEVDESRRAQLHNILAMAVDIAEDTIEIINEVDKK